MRKLFGLILLMSGLALAWLWLPTGDGNRQLAEVVEIRNGVARLAVPDAPETATSSESRMPVGRGAPVAPSLAISAPGPQQQTVAAPTTRTASSAAAHTGVAGQLSITNAALAAVEPRLGSPQPASDEAYYALVRDLQRELRRLGCYWGEVDGSWGLGTKRAMSALMARVNAKLPVNEPDYILLALARTQPDQACRRPCPPEQVLVADTGQCQPRAYVRQAASGHVDERASAHEPETATPAPLPGQMSVGGPRPDADLGPAMQRPRPPTSWFRYGEAPRRDNSWKRKVFGDLYGR
ncbi:MAG TPA: peptidoglycan-binding domain-containing protein [Hyphomicrobiaceae bacterium]|nr:peptidoglycan-binding domain-containing protein [Hyphomicrobiaceae bacterium]